MAATSLFWTQPHLRSLTPSGLKCSGGQLIVFTSPPLALCTGKPHYHPFPPSAKIAAIQLPSVSFALLQNSTLTPPGYLSLCPPGTRDVLPTILAFFSEAPLKPFTLLRGSARQLILPNTCLWTLYVMRFLPSLRKSLSSHSPRPTSYPCFSGGNLQSPTKPLELL